MKKLLLLLLLTTNITIINVCSADLKKAIEADKKGEYAAALIEFTTHAEQGNAEAQGWLGEYYLHGLGVTEDLKTAKKWFTLAAKQGDAESQRWLGEIYYFGDDRLPIRLKTSKKWFTLAAEQGHAKAQFWLGYMHLEGEGEPIDLKTAKKWLTLAANQDRVDAQYELGEIYWKENDLKSAKKWFDRVIQQFKDYEDETIVKPEFETLLLHYTKMRLAQIKIEESKTLLLESIK